MLRAALLLLLDEFFLFSRHNIFLQRFPFSLHVSFFQHFGGLTLWYLF